MKKILLTLIAVMIGAMSMHAQDDVYGKQQQLNEQKAQVELKQKLNRQEQKRLQQQIDSIQHEQALQAMRDSMFTLEVNRVVFKYGQRAYVTPSTNFVAVKKNKATVQLSFNIPVAGPNGMGGVTVEGTIGKYKMETDKKGSTTLSFYVQGIAISAQVYIRMWKDNNEASITVSPNFNSNRITLEGNILPSDQSFVVQGRTI